MKVLQQIFNVKPGQPLVIAGPCSAETEEQVYTTINNIVKHTQHVNVLRAGIWKPRTKPNSFEGMGKKGLAWIKGAGKHVGLPVSVEVANAKHVEQALQANIDILWIGARTTVSPFNVQEIANALKGVNVPVLIKNPVNPDLKLWLGAFERFQNVGLTKLAAIHRGFSTYGATIYRNPPHWEIPLEFMRLMPEIPMICDPSHICGKRSLLEITAQQALDLKMHGLMLETHINPDEAWSDAAQQITPIRLAELLGNLKIRQDEVLEGAEDVNLQVMRQKIDDLDAELIELLAQRMQISEEIGKYKHVKDIAIHQPKRWAHTVEKAVKLGKALNLTEEFVLQLFQKIHNESIQHQMSLFK